MTCEKTMRRKTRFYLATLTLSLTSLAVGYATVGNLSGRVGRDKFGAASAATPSASSAKPHAEFKTAPATVNAGEPATLGFTVKNAKGAAVRFLQFVHEKPLHLLVVSDDLAEFYHIHPELQMDDSYSVTHTFPHGGAYKLFADYTPPGSGQTVERFDLNVSGHERPRTRLTEDQIPTKAVAGLRVTISSDRPLVAGEDLRLNFAVADAKTERPVTDLQLYLGALAHFVIISEDLKDFIHAHPLAEGEVFDPAADKFTSHVHDPAELAKVLVGPSPSEVKAYASFPRAGLYKLWAQFQRRGQVITVPFVLRVAGRSQTTTKTSAAAPADAIKITVGASGYEPSRIAAKQGQPVKLAFIRTDAGNCGGTVVFPNLNLRQQLPVGETVVIEVTPQAVGELPFTCGMGMLKGTIVVN